MTGAATISPRVPVLLSVNAGTPRTVAWQGKTVYTAADSTRLPAARAGQYLTLRIPGAGQPAPVRGYSLSSAPGASAYRIGVKHEPHGTASSYLNRTLQPGAILEAAAPRGDFVLDM